MTAAGASRGSTPLRGLLLAVVHLLALWALAVAQPLYDVLRRNGDFFIAHRTTPLDLVLFTGLVSIGVPLVLAVPYVLTLAALAGVAGKVRGPLALGAPLSKSVSS